MWRPTPLYRARRLEQALGTGSRIYYKYEGVSPGRVAQAEHRRRRRPSTARGPAASGWPPRPAPASGAASLALACQVFGLECKVYMVRVSYDQKPYRRIDDGDVGRRRRPQPVARHQRRPPDPRGDPDSPGSLGIAICEAVEDAATREDTSYSLGSVLNHVLMHQTVIGQEAQKQLAEAGEHRRRRRHRLRRRRQQLRRPGASLRPRQDRRRRDRDRRLRAGRLPDADPRPLRLRLRRHRPADAAGADAHAGPRLRPARHPRRRPALPRRGAARSAAAGRADRARGVPARPSVRGRARLRPRRGDHPGARDRSTRSRAPSTSPAAPRRPAPHRRSCSTCPATATSTWPPTTPTSPASSRTTSCPRPRSSGRSGRSSRCPSRRG